MKICRICKIEKLEEYFYKRKQYGYYSECKECSKNSLKTIPKSNKKYNKSISAEKRKEYKAKYRSEGKELLWFKAWKAKNRGRMSSYFAARRARLKNATPVWLTAEHVIEMQEIYTMAKELQWLSDDELQVDHIIPLAGKNVCGLHVPWNLRIITGKENRKKYNKIVP